MTMVQEGYYNLFRIIMPSCQYYQKSGDQAMGCINIQRKKICGNISVEDLPTVVRFYRNDEIQFTCYKWRTNNVDPTQPRISSRQTHLSLIPKRKVVEGSLEIYTNEGTVTLLFPSCEIKFYKSCERGCAKLTIKKERDTIKIGKKAPDARTFAPFAECNPFESQINGVYYVSETAQEQNDVLIHHPFKGRLSFL